MSRDPELKVPSFIPVKMMFVRQRPWSLDARNSTAARLYRKSPGINVSCWKPQRRRKAVPRVSTVTVYWHGRHTFYVIAVGEGERWVISTSKLFIITGFFFFLWSLMNLTMSSGHIQNISEHFTTSLSCYLYSKNNMMEIIWGFYVSSWHKQNKKRVKKCVFWP